MENITPEDITEENAFIDENCKGCLAGHLWITEGFKAKHYHNDKFDGDEWARKVFGNDIGPELCNDLTQLHFQYMKEGNREEDRITFKQMQKEAIKILRSYLK